MFINDVGESQWEEINEGIAGANYGWAGSTSPLWEGFESPPPPWANYHDPLMAYDHSSSAPTPAGVAITGGVFYPAGSQFGAAYAGKYFFADFGANFIRVFDPANPGSLTTPDTSTAFASNLTTGGPVDLKVDAAGNLYYLARGGPGEVYRVSRTFVSTVAGRHVFYNNSKYDGQNAAANSSDDAAIAADKAAYLPSSGAATFANVTSYSKGINGIMIDLAGTHGTLSAADFTFKVGNNNAPSGWSTAPASATVTVRAGAGTGGSDRVEITWADGAILDKWLEVVVRGNDAAGGNNLNTGLAASDIFFFGNARADSGAGDTATQATVNATDELAARNNPHGQFDNIPVTNLHDYNRDGVVNVTDALLARNHPSNVGTAVVFVNIGSPPAVPATSGDAPEATASTVVTALSLSASATPTAAIATGIRSDLTVNLTPDVPSAAQVRAAVLASLESSGWEDLLDLDEEDSLTIVEITGSENLA
jgi:hypothetical protein